MNLNVKLFALSLLTISALSGCIRDDIGPCPNLNVILSVKDRQYFNSESEGYDDPHKNSTQFCDLVPTLYFLLSDAETGQAVWEMPVEKVHNTDDYINFEASYDHLPFGKYNLTVWGSLPDANNLGDDAKNYNLSGLDHELFVCHNTLDYNYDSATFDAQLERVNGLVIIETLWQTFPKGIDTSNITFTNLRAAVNNDLEYSGDQSYDLTNGVTNSKEQKSVHILPPSVKENGTKLSLRYFNSNHPELRGYEAPEMHFTVRRNEVKRIRIEFETYSKQIALSVLVNGEWQKVEGLKVD